MRIGRISNFGSFSATVRSFHTTCSCQGKIKKLVNSAHSDNAVLRIRGRMKEERSHERNERLHLKRGRSGMKKQRVAHILTKVTGNKVDINKIGPTTDEDVQYMNKSNIRMLYTMLGTNRSQLQDSVLVARSVEIFLRRGQEIKALMTMKLAQEKGAHAMNNTMMWYIQQNRVNKALEAFTLRRKWNIPVDAFTFPILFGECGKLKDTASPNGALTVLQTKKLLEIAKRLGSGAYEGVVPERLHINGVASALVNCPDKSIAFKFIENIDDVFPKLRPNAKTYTIMLQGIQRSDDDAWVIAKSDEIWDQVKRMPESKIDRELYEAYVFCYSRRSAREAIYFSILLIHAFFDISVELPKLTQHIRSKFVGSYKNSAIFPEIKEGPKKFPASNKILDALMNGYNKIGRRDLTVQLFKEHQAKAGSTIDRGLIQRYIEAHQLADQSNAAEISIELYKSLKREFPKLFENSHQIARHCFRGMFLESITDEFRKKSSNSSVHIHVFKKAEEFLQLLKEEQGKNLYDDYQGYFQAVKKLKLPKDLENIVSIRRSEARDLKYLAS